ncbi:MAG: hypothetical protein UR26_C0003G0114 [candidate division TM6 bacterium GW2011_GWF2_32_72]|nr:MAG: hypothetical protein UR26_C0003G0114 [candidate division TM6 bacterium GW2011_GWF2_32_72]
MNKFYKNKSILVSGGAGFIGSTICKKLVSLDAKVTVLDNLSSGNLNNLKEIQDKIEFIKGDVRCKKTCLQAAQNKHVIFHLAALVSVPESVEKPRECHENNVDGTFNLLEAANLTGVESFIFSSSSAVYGKQTEACHENMMPNPESPYGASKLIGEILCKQFAINTNLKTVCLRYFNVFGPNQNPKGSYAAVVAKFKDCMINNQDINIFGDGLQTRDFIPVEQVVEANLKAAMLPKEKMGGEIFNVATGKSITLLELIDTLKKDFPHFTGTIKTGIDRPGDLRHSSANCNKLKELM